MNSNDLQNIDRNSDQISDPESDRESDQTQTKIVFKSNVLKTECKISDEELHSLYVSLDIHLNQINPKYSLWRLQVLHIRGVQDMSSEDVLKYFEDFEPNSIEWVNDLSCNVVFSDEKCAATAMMGLTTALVIKTSKHPLNCDFGIEVIDSDSLFVPIPPQFRWRLGKTFPKSKALLLRFATNKDRKVSDSRPLSQYYSKYSASEDVSNKRPTSERKRRYNWDESNNSIDNRRDTDLDLRSKRFRMRADDEQQLIQNRKIMSAKMRITEEDTRPHRKSIWDRLDNDSSGNYCAVDTDLLQIALDNNTNARQIWRHRESPLRSTVFISRKHKNISDKNDLRTKLTKNSH